MNNSKNAGSAEEDPAAATDSPRAADDRLTDVEYWADFQPATINIPPGGVQPSWFKLIGEYLPKSKDTRFLEIGVVPGRVFMFIASTLGYRCTGIDFSARVEQVAAAFERENVAAEFVRADFLQWEPDSPFDVVFSGGFIEHFEDYQAILLRHWELVAPGGLMLIQVPTWTTPVQMLLRRLFFTKEAMRHALDAHNLQIMNVRALTEAVEKCPGARILINSYLPGMPISYHPSRRWTWPLWYVAKVLQKAIGFTGITSRFTAAGAVVLAEKR